MTALNRHFDRLANTHVVLAGRRVRSFHAAGAAGLIGACALAIALTVEAGLSLRITSLIGVTACATFLIVAMATKILTGEERLVYYHHSIAVLTGVAVLLHLLRQPVTPYLSVAALGLGLFLVCGRLGCFMGGCCHGKPSRTGVCYGHEHAADGAAAYLPGVRVFPVQLLDSGCTLMGATAGIAEFVRDHEGGSALVSFLGIQAAARFYTEFLRGDAQRSPVSGQSLCVLHLAVIGAAATAGFIELQRWQWALLLLPVPALPAAMRRRHLLDPDHIWEIGRAIRHSMHATSQGLLISSRTVDGVRLHTISRRDRPLTAREAVPLAHTVARLQGLPRPAQILSGRCDTYHVLLGERS